MMHHDRHWCVTPVATPEELAEKLTTICWCCCTAFSIEKYVIVNDSTGPDGAQEWGIVKLHGSNGRPLQIESITFGWCDREQTLSHLRRILSGEYDQSEFAHPVEPRLESPEEHGRCPHCA